MSRLRYILSNPFRVIPMALSRLPFFGFIRGTADYQCAITFGTWFNHKILNYGGNRRAYWPVHKTSRVIDEQFIYAGVDTCPGLSMGCYITGTGGLSIGDYTQIAPFVTIVTANHHLYDSRVRIPKPVKIGKYCWIGAHAIILPGVELGDFTIVGAGAVVTKSFEDGFCVVAGNPARLISRLEQDKCIRYEKKERYLGYIKESGFERYRKDKLKI
jgi:acetyltransferase-like isoleucine patch superfamily enzyme